MESYEKIRKMGEISEQLKKHGLAEDSTEALKKAEEMLAKEGTEFYVKQDKIKEFENKSHENQDDTQKIIKKISSQFNDKISDLDSQVGLIRDKMNEIIAKLNELESKITSQQKHEVQATLTSKNNNEQEKKQEKSEYKVNPEVKKEYTPDDVAVDKMFYVGKK
jgi:phage-related protein